MTEYKPKLIRTGHIPFGYYLAPGETKIALPDPKALDALHYSFQMKMKYKTPLRDCTMWLQRATGYKITPQGFKHLYDRWAKELRKTKRREITARTKKIYEEKKKDMELQYAQFGTAIDETRDIASVAYAEALKKWKEKQQSPEEETPEEVQDDNITFQASPGPQIEFLAASEREVLYGGAKGGGKSHALLVDPLRYCSSRHSRNLIIRRSTPDLRDFVSKSLHLYNKAYPDAKYNAQQNMWRFPSGATIEFTFCENPSDLSRFQGINMTYCGLDEAASHPYLPELLNYVRSNIRSVDPVNVPPMLRLTANPGEVASHYLRKEFVERATPNTTFWDHVKIFDARKKEFRTVNISKKYIPATIFDNPYLLKDDSYLATLASLPETKRKQWLEGNWFVSEMSAFPDFDEHVHVVPPFEIGHDWKRVKGQDWGFSSDGAIYWGAVKPNGQLVIYREFVFRRKDAMQVAHEGRAMELGEPRSPGIIDASAFQQRGTLGQSIGEIMQMNWPGWVPSSRARMGNTSSRAHRKNLVHTHLAIDPRTGEPRMVIFPNCRKLIEALAGIPVDKNNPEVVDTDSSLDHYFDALSYLLQGRPSQLRSWSDPFEQAASKPYPVQDAVFGY